MQTLDANHALLVAAATARPGTAVLYHTGFLVVDRVKRPDLADIADAFLALSAEGRVVLAQRRRGEARFDYLAVVAR